MIRELCVLLLSVIVCFQQTESVELSTIASHPCDPNPCENGGTCSKDASAYGYYCTCPNGIYGYKCDKHKCLPRFDYRAASDTCIRVVFEMLTWNEAQKRCHDFQGAYLTIVNDVKEDKDQGVVLQSYKKDMDVRCKGRAWIAAQRDDVTCKTPYVWKPNDDDYLPLKYSNWYTPRPGYTAQPDCDKNVESCAAVAAIHSDADYQWHDINCAEQACFICESGPYEKA